MTQLKVQGGSSRRLRIVGDEHFDRQCPSCTLCLLVMLTMQAQLSSLQTSLADAERRVYESELIRRKLHNTIQVR